MPLFAELERYFRYFTRQADILVHASHEDLEEAILEDLAQLDLELLNQIRQGRVHTV